MARRRRSFSLSEVGIAVRVTEASRQSRTPVIDRFNCAGRERRARNELRIERAHIAATVHEPAIIDNSVAGDQDHRHPPELRASRIFEGLR